MPNKRQEMQDISMKVQKIHAVLAAMVVLSFILSAWLYPALPERSASHWNAAGRVDGYMSKSVVAVFMPAIITALVLLLLSIPRIDPLKANIDKFRGHYHGFILIITGFMLFMHVFTLLWNVGIRVNPNSIIPLGLGVLFYYIGGMLEHTKRNWFIGIRTPWTLSSDRVWDATHKRGGILFKVCGIVALFGVAFPAYTIYLILVPVLLSAAYCMVFSYIEYTKEAKDAGKHGQAAASVKKPVGKPATKAGKAAKKKAVQKKRTAKKPAKRKGKKSKK